MIPRQQIDVLVKKSSAKVSRVVDRLTLLRLSLGEEFQLYDFADVCVHKHTFEQVFLAFITIF